VRSDGDHTNAKRRMQKAKLNDTSRNTNVDCRMYYIRLKARACFKDIRTSKDQDTRNDVRAEDGY